MILWGTRLAALLVVAGLVAAGAPCPCAAPSPAAPEDHCGTPAPGVEAAHDGCACPCMTGGGDVAERSEPDARAPFAPIAAAPAARPVRVALEPRATRAPSPPERAAPSPPSVLRI